MTDDNATSDAQQKTAHDLRPERVLVIAAHPDDADFGVAATMAKWIAAGSVGRLVCCTSGDAGADDAPARAFISPTPRPRPAPARAPMTTK